ncbi:MAG: hypothetical protein PHV82_16970 [Victivallaceae bacterium]|nr:hypothetical protein [Victivallaceae bacterium]
MKIPALCLIGLSLSVFAYAGIDIREYLDQGKKIVVIENELYKTVLVPEIARLPLSYVYKPTGHEMFAHPYKLSRPNKGFQYYGGVLDSLPWVDGKVNGKRLKPKGFLYSSPWNYTIGKDSGKAWFEGQTGFVYTDPENGDKSQLFFEKRITGYAQSAGLLMDYLIKNTGKTNARFSFAAHSRTAIAKYDKGDYFYAPGDRCHIYCMVNKELEAKGIKPPCWGPWPLSEAVELIPQKKLKTVLAFVPSNWCAIGDEKYKEALFFIAGPIDHAGRKDIMKMGIFMTNAGYVIEPSLTYSIDFISENWKDPHLTLVLKPGQECRFSLTLAVYQGISKREMPDISAVYPECVVMRPSTVTLESGKNRLDGKIAVSAKGVLEIKTGMRTLTRRELMPGLFDLSELGKFTFRDKRNFSLIFHSGNRRITLYKTSL